MRYKSYLTLGSFEFQQYQARLAEYEKERICVWVIYVPRSRRKIRNQMVLA